MGIPADYDAERDFATSGTVVCGDCGTRVKPRTLESLPPHGCADIQASKRATAYAIAVMNLLHAEFPDLLVGNGFILDQHGYVSCRIMEHARRPDPTLEVTLDHPLVANWRLLAEPRQPGRVRVGCFRVHLSPQEAEREGRVNAALAAIAEGLE